jgi:hypothetical protein
VELWAVGFVIKLAYIHILLTVKDIGTRRLNMPRLTKENLAALRVRRDAGDIATVYLRDLLDTIDALAAELSDAKKRETQTDNYVAWLRYIREGERTRIVVCDSDADGAFMAYRHSKSETQLATPSARGVAYDIMTLGKNLAHEWALEEAVNKITAHYVDIRAEALREAENAFRNAYHKAMLEYHDRSVATQYGLKAILALIPARPENAKPAEGE